MIYYSNNSRKLGTNDPKNVGLKVMKYGNKKKKCQVVEMNSFFYFFEVLGERVLAWIGLPPIS